MKDIFNKTALFIAQYSFYIVAVLYSIANVFFTVERLKYGNQDNIYLFGLTPIHIIIVIFLLMVILFLYKNNFFDILEKKLFIVLCILSTILSLYWILSNSEKLIIKSDDLRTFYAALKVGVGDYSPLDYKSYMNLYPNNLSLMTYFMIFTRLFGENATIAIRLSNIIYMLIAYYSIYKITSIMFENRKINILVILLLFINFQFPFLTFVCYGNCPSYACSLFSVYFVLKYLKNEKPKYILFAMVSISFAIFCRQNALIVLIAEILILIVNFVNRKKVLIIISIILMALGAWISTTGIQKFWENKSGNSYDNKLPRICWVAYGMNYAKEYPGSFSSDLEKFHIDHDFDTEGTKTVALDKIRNVIKDFKKNPSLLPEFLGRKFLVAFSNPHYGVFNYEQYDGIEINKVNTSIIKGKMNSNITEIWDAGLSIMSIGIVFYIVIRKKQVGINELLCGIVFVGGALFHTVWELKALYMYQYFLFLFPYAAFGLSNLLDKCNNKLNKL